jgi:GH15 family glucan-1,4-alpha-glucosidase
MPRDLCLGNGRLLVTFDADYVLRDLYYPHVGKENQTIGHPCRTGIWVEGRFAWLSDGDWVKRVRFRPDSLVTDVHLEHPQLGIRIHASDAVHAQETVLVRTFDVMNLAGHLREVRMFFHHDFRIAENEIGDTAYFEPVNRFVCHYKGRRYLLINGRSGSGDGIFQYDTGQKGPPTDEGTWRDAEDGWLDMNPISQGAVDSTISLRQNLPPGKTGRFHCWIAAADDYWSGKALNKFVLTGQAGIDTVPFHDRRIQAGRITDETDRYWHHWIGRAPGEFADLPEPVGELYRRSLLVIQSQIDGGGAIMAANDGDSMMTNRDTYSYMWPRDGALVAHTLDAAGYHEVTERFFRFCERLMPRPSFFPAGYLLHKFNPDGSLGSSWHPWVRENRPSLPVQEDETALVVWALWDHCRRRGLSDPAVQGLVQDLARSLVLPAARFMLLYRDLPQGRAQFRQDYHHEPTGLPLASYDLWEERYGIHFFTVAATCAGLNACARFLELVAERGWARDESWSRSAALYDPARETFVAERCQDQVLRLRSACAQAVPEMKAALQNCFWVPERSSFGRMVTLLPGGRMEVDRTLDASTLYALVAFGVFSPDDCGVRESLAAISARLGCQTAVGGMARYEDDYYRRQSDDIARVPGNPWFICTLWGALGQLFLAGDRGDLERPRRTFDWVCARARPSGVLAEQLHPYTGAAIQVAPLTWSHATFVETVLAYAAKYRELH